MKSVLSAIGAVGFAHHYNNNSHHPEYYEGKKMPDVAVIESIVDGLACIFEQNKAHESIEEWIGYYNPCRYTHKPNKSLAEGVLKALKTHITIGEYEQLRVF